MSAPAPNIHTPKTTLSQPQICTQLHMEMGTHMKKQNKRSRKSNIFNTHTTLASTSKHTLTKNKKQSTGHTYTYTDTNSCHVCTDKTRNKRKHTHNNACTYMHLHASPMKNTRTNTSNTSRTPACQPT